MAMVSPARHGIAIGRSLGAVVVTVHGDLDVAASRHLGSVLADLIDGQGNLDVVVDLREAGAADAGSLSVLATAADRAARRGTELSLSDPPELLHQALARRGLGALVRTTRHGGRHRSSTAKPNLVHPPGRASHPAGAARDPIPPQRSPT
ncbi:MAG: STAS domain-containing protein [Acidimicrobiales bacterium]